MPIRLKKPNAFSVAGAVFVAVFASVAVVFCGLATLSLGGIERRAHAVTLLHEADRAVLTIPFAVMSILEFDDSTEAGRQAPVTFLDASREARRALVAAADGDPEIESLRKRLDVLVEKAREPLVLGNAAPTVERGASLSAADLDMLASGARLAAAVTPEFQALSRDIGALSGRFVSRNAAAAQSLRERAWAGLLLLAAVGAAALWAVWAGARRALLLDLVRRRQTRRSARAFEVGMDADATPALALDVARILAEEEAAGRASLALFPPAEPMLPMRSESLRDPQAWSRPRGRDALEDRRG